MNHYKAIEQAAAPFLVFKRIAITDEELVIYLLTEPNPQLIRPENNLPSYAGGICHSKILNGEIVDRDQSQIDAFIQATSEKNTIAANSDKAVTLKGNSFVFNTVEYPMDEGSQKRYEAIFAAAPVNHQIQTKDSVETLNSGDIPAFKTAYYDAVLAATAP